MITVATPGVAAGASHRAVRASGAPPWGSCRGHDPGVPDRTAEAREQLGNLALREQSMESVLQAVVGLAGRVLPGDPEASISMVVNGRPSTTTSTALLALELDMYACQDARAMAGNLQVALQSRAVVDQAEGILMERHTLTADAAFQALSAVSMRSNTKVRGVADQLVRTDQFELGAARPEESLPPALVGRRSGRAEG